MTIWGYQCGPPSMLGTITAAFARFMPGIRGGLFSDMEKVIAPIYSTKLLASRRPFVFTLHDMQERYYPQYFTLAQRTWRHLVNSSLSRTAGIVICESNYVREDIHRFLGVGYPKIAVVPSKYVTEL